MLHKCLAQRFSLMKQLATVSIYLSYIAVSHFRYSSPNRSNSLKLPDATGGSSSSPDGVDLRKRSCPDTIHEDHQDDPEHTHRGKKE